MNRKFIFIAFTVVVVLVMGYSFLWMKSGFIDYKPKTYPSKDIPTQTSTQTPIQPSVEPVPKSSLTDKTANWKTYRNNQYGFEFRYPSDYSFDVIKDSKGSDWLFDLISPTKEYLPMRLEDNRFPELDTFEKFAIGISKSYCSADNDGLSQYCSNENKISEFTNSAGINGYEIYLNATIENHITNQKTNKIMGPIFVLDFSPLNNSYARGMFLGRGNAFSDSEREIIAQIISTFKFTR